MLTVLPIQDKNVQKVINQAAEQAKVMYKDELDKIDKFTGKGNK